MKLTVRFSSIGLMLEALAKQLRGELGRDELREILSHEDVQFEFMRYKAIGAEIGEEEYLDYFLALPEVGINQIESRALKAQHCYMQYLMENLNLFLEARQELEHLTSPSMLEQQFEQAAKWLPEHLNWPEIRFIFTIGIGGSGGYVWQNSTCFDFIKIVKDSSLDSFAATLCHEIHHVGMGVLLEEINLDALSLESWFYAIFSGEGLAVKYCNNAEGVLSKAIYSGSKNVGLDRFSWDYLNQHFEEYIQKFCQAVRAIRSGEVKTREELWQLIGGLLMGSHTHDQEPGEIPRLMHTPLYSLGNELWGLIHDCFGKDVVFDALRNLNKFPELLNAALSRVGRDDLSI